VYFHAVRPTSRLNAFYETLYWYLWRNWSMNKNFSEQDARGAIETYHDTPEHLSPSDIQTVMWRKFILTARGLKRDRLQEDADSSDETVLPVEAGQTVSERDAEAVIGSTVGV
jgi:hypothetical protein